MGNGAVVWMGTEQQHVIMTGQGMKKHAETDLRVGQDFAQAFLGESLDGRDVCWGDPKGFPPIIPALDPLYYFTF